MLSSKKALPVVNCEECMHYYYDDEMGFYVCEMELDEDEMEGFLRGQMRSCPFYEPGDEYKIVRHQI
ncbi:MAG: hypothetical protein HUJ69_03595 [Lachnospiraceae bacterium]|nr:hypothetical protein [Lachnospiraceae bacterium]